MPESPRHPPASGGAALAERLPVATLEVDAEGLLSWANASFARLTAIRPGEADGLGWFAALPLESRPALLSALALRRDFDLSIRLLRADGVKAWVEFCARWQADRQAFIAVCIDVTTSQVRELAARGEAEQFRLVANNVPVLIAYYDAASNRCRFANRRYAETFGHDERSILGLTVPQVIGEEAARKIQPQVDHVLANKASVNYERHLTAADGTRRWIEVHLLPHLDLEGTPIGAFVLISDITKYRVAESTVRESEERLAKFMQASVEGIVFHRDGLITDVNPPLLQLLGYTPGEMLGRSTLDFIAADHRERVVAVIASGHEITYESMVVHKDGTRIPVEFIVRTMLYQTERLRMTIVRDLRDRQAALARIHYLAHHDALTGLPNRGSFLERVEEATVQAAASGHTLALLFVDIDHFKRVNDSLGHLAGDALLQVVALRITGALRSTDLVARFAGDEFVVLLGGEQRHADIKEVADKLLGVIEAPIELDGREISVTPSIGVALYPQDGDTPAELLKHADTAMYHAKAKGRAQCLFFEPAMARAAYDALVMESELAQALQQGQFVLFFQPQVQLSDGALGGYEALVRWQHPQRGLLSPNDFIPVAEERRLMLGIGHWVLSESLRHALDWRRRGLTDARVGVNLSTMQFQAAGFVELVEQVLAEHGADGSCLELELTERMLMDDLDAVRGTLERLRARGIRIAVDDFGTGYTSLARLKDLAVDRLKIDRSFIKDLPGDRGSAAITDAIIRMARGLELDVVAEGVETPEQLAWLAAHGCGTAQGHLITPAMDAAHFEAWLRSPQPQAANGVVRTSLASAAGPSPAS
jgi:diguanylate cyclase (GGDEF)-like protein/PAS domain S-box-containing protein